MTSHRRSCLQPIERGGGVAQFAHAVVEAALAEPTPRVLKRNTEKPRLTNTWNNENTTLWFIVPPYCGCG